MNLEKIKYAMKFSESTTLEEFLEELLDSYIAAKESIDLADIGVTPIHYAMEWGNEKQYSAKGYSINGKKITVAQGSNFSVSESLSINEKYSEVRKQLLEDGVIDTSDPDNYRFAEDYSFGSFSTAGSVIRGFNINGLRSFKKMPNL